jgi:hypothetical protein
LLGKFAPAPKTIHRATFPYWSPHRRQGRTLTLKMMREAQERIANAPRYNQAEINRTTLEFWNRNAPRR